MVDVGRVRSLEVPTLISRLGRKRRERRAPTQPDHPFEVESCEYLTDGAFALLRVSGSGSEAPVALITQGDGPESFDRLPQPDDGVTNGVWQIAFALPTDVIEPGARVWLHDGGLYLADLMIPFPAEPRTAARPEAEEPARPEPARPEPVAEQGGDDDEAAARKVVEAWSEAAQLREKLADREEELAKTLKELLEARAALEGREPAGGEVERLRAEIARLEQELAAARAETAAAEQQRAKLEEANKSRRAGIARRREDRDARREIAELEAKLSERDERIGELEAEAGEDARQRAATNDDLRALLESERETAAAARREVEDLKQQLAAASAEFVAKAAEPNGAPVPRAAVKPAQSPDGVQSPPWSALDDELLARIEKAKALTK
jgi:predicted  nucleic acid-binding Zn-ribbon protein